MHVARLKRISRLKVVVAGALLTVAVLAALLVLVAAEKPAEAAFPGKNGKIAFWNYSSGDTDIYTIDEDGSNRTQLTNEPGGDGHPAWSPDGTKIAFASDRDGGDSDNIWDGDIWTMNGDGSAPIRITNDSSNDYMPTWSPDGARIAFISDRDSRNGDLYVMDADGSEQTRLTFYGEIEPGMTYPTFPEWSPDGTRIAFTVVSLSRIDIYVMNADGSNQTNITSGNDSWDTSWGPTWSPDGSKIAYQRIQEYEDPTGVNRSGIWTMNPDGSNQTYTTVRGGYEPAWSPDGSKIAYLMNDDVWTMSPDGSNQTNITNTGAGYRDPDWQPLPDPTLPTSKAQCKRGGYKDFGFKNQGRCVASVQRAAESG